jgi:phospholipase/carboxylesterase
MNSLTTDRFWDSPPVVLEPKVPARAALFWLHGLGADGNDFVAVAETLARTHPAIRHILPHAPRRPLTLNQGMVMRAWYDIALEGERWVPNDDDLLISCAAIQHLIENEVQRGLPARNIFIAGFSQGGAIALTTGTRMPVSLGGILALSTYLPLSHELAQRSHPANRALPIFMAHGTQDPVIPWTQGNRSRQFLERAGYPVTWHSYPMPHSVCEEEIRDMTAWLAPHLTENP